MGETPAADAGGPVSPCEILNQDQFGTLGRAILYTESALLYAFFHLCSRAFRVCQTCPHEESNALLYPTMKLLRFHKFLRFLLQIPQDPGIAVHYPYTVIY